MSTTSLPVTFGTSLFCLTHEHHARTMTLVEQIEAVAARGLGPGLELVGYQCLRDFPNVDPRFATWFKDALDTLGLQPTCLDGEVDLAVRRDRVQSEDELVAAVEAQLNAARQLGFPVLRIQMLAGPNVVERCAPAAEAAGVALGVELDSFYSVDHPAVHEMRTVVERLQTEFVGFVPDFGASMSGIPRGLLDSLADSGVSPALLQLAEHVWADHRLPEDRMNALLVRAGEVGARDEDLAPLRVPMTVCGAQAPEAWSEIALFALHVHAKFFEFDENGEEPNVDQRAALDALVDGGFRGTASSEWGGVMYTDTVPGLDMVAQHHALLHRITEGR